MQKGATDAEVERALRRRHGPGLPPPTAFGFPTMRALLKRDRRNSTETVILLRLKFKFTTSDGYTLVKITLLFS